MQSKNSKTVAPFVSGILLANAIMYVRVFIEVQIVYPELAKTVAIPLFTMAFTASIAGLIALLLTRKNVARKNQAISQPFALSEALKFGAFFVVILIMAEIIPHYFGDAGLYATGIISGLADTDAITLSMSDLARKGEVGFHVASVVISLAVLTNTLIKIIITAFFANRRVTLMTGAALLAVMISGGLSLFFV